MRQTSYRIEHLCTLGKALVLHYFDPHSVADRLCAVLERLDPPDIQPHRRIELQRPPPRRRFWTSEQHTYLFSQLVDENGGGLCLVDCAGQFPEGLGHEAGLQADVAVAELALDLGECGLESLLAVVRCHEMSLPYHGRVVVLSSGADATGNRRQFADTAATVDNVATGTHFTEQKFDQPPTRRFVSDPGGEGSASGGAAGRRRRRRRRPKRS